MNDNWSRLLMRCARLKESTRLSFLAQFPPLKNVQIAVRYAAMTAVAGDLYDFPTVRPNCIGVLVADVMGHGVPAALVASMVKVAVSSQHEHSGEPANIIAELNTTLCREA